MRHFGDITKLNGTELPIVDIITGGSPCQGLSVAGKRKGLEDERSGLFVEQIRLIKEMREHDRNNGTAESELRPRYMVFENVQGLLSCTQGQDFQAVLEETVKIADENAVIPRLEEGQKWSHAGLILAENFSVAWRLHDAQYWGVPQRRKRLCMVADFNGQSAGEILFNPRLGGETEYTETFKTESDTRNESRPEIQFVSESVSRDIEQSEKEGETVARNTEDCINQTSGKYVCYGIGSYDSNAMKSSNPHSGIYEADTSRTLDLNGGNPACNQGGMAVVQIEKDVTVRKYPVDEERLKKCLREHKNMSANEIAEKLNKPKTLVEHWFRNDKCFAIPDAEVWYDLKKLLGIDTDEFDKSITEFELQPCKYDMSNRIHLGDISPTLTAVNSENTLYCIEGNGSRESHKGDGYKESEIMYTLNTVEQHAVFDARGNGNGNLSPTITGDHENRITDYTAVCVGPSTQRKPNEDNFNKVISYDLDRAAFNQGKNALYDFTIDEEMTGSQVARDPDAVFQSVVRRLTPTECERLQNFPDGWTDIGDWYDDKGKKHKGEADSPRYKALGNSICLPFWQWMAERIIAVLKKDGIENPTMGSLFSGIGGFELVFKRIGCEPLWASEIEPFPIAVVKKHFGDEDTGEIGDIEKYL